MEATPSSVRRVLASGALLFTLTLSSLAYPLAGLADDVDPQAMQAREEEDPAESRSATFQAVTGAVGEDVPGGPLLVAAYGAVLAMVLGYVLYLGSLTAGASRDLERLEKTIADRTAKKPDAPKA